MLYYTHPSLKHSTHLFMFLSKYFPKQEAEPYSLGKDIR